MVPKVPLNIHTSSSSPQSSFASTPHTRPLFDGYYEFCTSSSTMNCLVGPFLFLWPLGIPPLPTKAGKIKYLKKQYGQGTIHMMELISSYSQYTSIQQLMHHLE